MECLAPQESTVRIGCAGWALPSDIRHRFPAAGTILQRYAQEFNCVEVNSSFYRPHRPSTYARWADSVPSTFRFSVKVPKTITHQHRLVDCDSLVGEFLMQVSGLGPRLGFLLVQLPPSLAFDLEIAGPFLSRLRLQYAGGLAIEPRHRSWLGIEATTMLTEYRVSRVAADPAMDAGAAEPGGCTEYFYYRQHGSPITYRSNYEAPAIRKLADRVMASAAMGRPTWCIFDNTAAGHAISNALDMRALMPLISPDRMPHRT